MTLRLPRRAARLTGSLIRDILQVTQRPGVISFAGGLPVAEAMPPLYFEGLVDDYCQYGSSEGEPALRLNFSHAAPANIERGVALLAEILNGCAE